MKEKIVEQKVNIYSLKSLLRTIVSLYEEKKQLKDDAKYLSDLYNDLIALINNVNISEIISNTLSISLLLPLIYKDEKAKTIEEKIVEYSYSALKLKDNKDLKNDYDNVVNKLNKIIRKIISEYEILNNKYVIYTNELNDLYDKAYLCRGILYNLNTKRVINDYQIKEIKIILRENDFNEEQQIIIQEYIRNHNIECMYDNPKISHTTINMLEKEFPLYDTEELIDRDIKAKLDECSNSMYDALISDEELDIVSFVNEFTSWMNENNLEYILKTVLNKFIYILNRCKEDMVKDNNYEDRDLRKIIIDDYNSSYYPYLKLLKYYNDRFCKKEIVVEEAEIEVEKKEERHLFFAMSHDISYVEKDIEHIPNEYYRRVKKLLEGFRFNKLNEQSLENFASNSKLKGYKKLKEDQIRIMFRQLVNDNYLVLGIMLKKCDRANRDYINIIKRDYNYNITDENMYNEKYLESEQIYSSLMQYIDDNSRKGNR